MQFVADLLTGEHEQQEHLYDEVLHCFVVYDDGSTHEVKDSGSMDPEAWDAIDVAWRSCFEGGPA